MLELHFNQDKLLNICEVKLSPNSSTLQASQCPVNEQLATLSHSENVYCTQTSLSDHDSIIHTNSLENWSGIGTEPRVETEPRESDLNMVSSGLELLLQKSVSPLPMPTLDNKLPVFNSTDIVEHMRKQFKPKHPLKRFTRALTLPAESESSIESDTCRRSSSPNTYNAVRRKVVPKQVFEYPDKHLKRFSRRKSLSHDDINQLFKEEATLSKVKLPMHCLSSENLPTCGRSKTESCFSFENSTGVCGLGSDLSWEDSLDEGVLLKAQPKDLITEQNKGILSSLSKDVLISRLRERKELMSKKWAVNRYVSACLPSHMYF